jgi:BirA family biotin operon repressor/biotin-[acetyl-CoA-carboxylase] ligase
MTQELLEPIRWPAESIWQAVYPSLPDFTVEVLPQIDSTNSELMRRFRGAPGLAPRPEATLLVAEQQSAGRGRLGRSWQSRRGDTLTFSLGLPLQPVSWSGLSLAVGVSLADSLEPLQGLQPPRIQLKWPNDLWLNAGSAQQPSKLAGILIETASAENLRYVVIGVGINIRALELAAADAQPGLPSALKPGALQSLFPELDAPQTLLRVLAPLVQAVQAFEQFGFAPFQSRFTRRDALSGLAVQLFEAQQITEGTAHGVTDSGALLLHSATGMREISSAEVSIRPLSTPGQPC